MKKVNKTTTIGLDTVEVTVNKHITLDTTEIKSQKHNKSIGRITPVKDGVKISICLPKALREDNIQPLGVVDACQLLRVITEVTEALECFQIDISQAQVRRVEINSTAELENPTHVPAIMKFLSLMLLQNDIKVFVTAHGENDVLYKNIPLDSAIFRTRPVIESIRTERLTNKRFAFKFYNKGLESNIEGKGILRLEQVHNKESLNYAGISDELQDFLSLENIVKLIDLFKKDFQKSFLDVLWYDPATNVTFPYKLVNTIQVLLKDRRPQTVAEIQRDLISIDFELFERACYAHYGEKKKIAQQAIRRVEKSERIPTQRGAITELVKIFRAIVY